MHRMIRSLSSLSVGVFTLMAGCSDSSGPSARPVNQVPSLIVSSPENQGAAANADVVGGIGWVSLPPGSVPDGQSAMIRYGRSGVNVAVVLVDGGFDPVAISASVGDTIFVDITHSGNSTPLTGFQVVAIRKAPSVVRTSPPRGKSDVPLNAAIVAVFSAPVDPATLSPSSFGLLRGGAPVAGTVRLVGTSGISAEFFPDSALAPQTSYELFVTQAIRDVNGVPLATAVTGTFSTGSTTQGNLVGGSVTGLAGTGLVLALNNVEMLPVAANGTFIFSTQLAQGAAVDITVKTLPSNPSQICTVEGGTSVMPNGPDMNAVISCSTVMDATGKILFSSTNGGTVSHVFALDLDHLTILPLTSGGNDENSPRWSPDHTRIAFVRSGGASTTGVWVMNADGTQQARISPVGYGGIAWSPDGTRLLVTSGDTVRNVNADGSGAVDVGIMNAPPKTVCLADPVWSPDGATIAGSCTTDEGDIGAFTQAYLMNPDGSNLRRLTNEQTYGSPIFATGFAEAEPAWSPTGLRVAFWSFAFGATIANADGSNAYSVSGDRPIQNVPPSVFFGASPDWSPDGKWIVYRNNDGQLDISASTGLGRPVTVTSIAGGASSPAWSR